MKTNLQLALGTTLAVGIALSAASAFAENPFSATAVAPAATVPAAPATAPAAATPAPVAAAPATPAKMGEMKCGGMMMQAGGTGDATCPSDTNKDGKVTKEEFLKHHEAMFDAADANKDGTLDKTEQDALHTNMRAMMGGGKMGAGNCGGMMKAAPDTDKK